MSYRIDWVGEVALGVRTEGGRPIAFSLEEGQIVPSEFKVGDEVDIQNHPAHPAKVEMGMNDGYYDIIHLASKKVL